MGATTKYRVKKGNTVRMGTASSVRRYGAGDLLELSEDDARAMPWAVEPFVEGEAKKADEGADKGKKRS